MNILFITIAYSLNSGGIYSDLCEALAGRGHRVKVAFSDNSLPDGVAGEIASKGGVEVLRVKSPQVQKVGLVKKGLAFLRLPSVMKAGIEKFYGGERFDLIIALAPPVSLCSVYAWAKRKYKCPVFLMQKDIFPQNAVDLGMFSKLNPAYWFFRMQERKMLSVSDRIGCMSQGNIDYIKKHNPDIDSQCVVMFPNTMKVMPQRPDAPKVDRKKYGIPGDACVFLFGGNIGVPQHIELLEAAMERFDGRRDIFFVCIGSGAKAAELRSFVRSRNFSNSAFFDALPREDYEALAASCDVGLVTLSPKFTIPNYPSKTLSYMATRLPILAATDLNTDYRDLVESQAKCGLWCDSARPADFFANIERLASDAALRAELGANGRRYLEENFDVSRSAEIIEAFLGGE